MRIRVMPGSLGEKSQCVSVKDPCMFCVRKTMRQPLRFEQIKALIAKVQRSTSSKIEEK